jgi:hypothetical protein
MIKVASCPSLAKHGVYWRQMEKQKNRAAQELVKLRYASMTEEERSEAARHAGTFGGAARAKALSAKRRRAIAKKAAAARWGKK